jgi:hypothetical protein
MNGTDLLLRELNVFCTTKTNHRQTLEQLKQMALTNNTTGASIYDLGNIMKADNIAEVTHIMKEAEEKQRKQREAEMQQMQQMKEQELQARQQEAQMKLQVEQEEAEKERQKDIMVAEIRAAGYGSMQDINQNQVSDYQDALKDIRDTDRYREQMNVKREDRLAKTAMHKDSLALKREELRTKKEIADKQLQIARENKNKYDVEE